MNYKNSRLLLLISLFTLMVYTGPKLATLLQHYWPQTEKSVKVVQDHAHVVAWDFPTDTIVTDTISPVWTLVGQEKSPATLNPAKPGKTTSSLKPMSSLHDDPAAASRQFFIAGVLVDGEVKVVHFEALLSQTHQISYDEPTHSPVMRRHLAVN